MRPVSRLVFLVLLPFLLSACESAGGDDGAPPAPGTPGWSLPASALAQPVEWAACPLNDVPEWGAGTAECADLRVPLDWSRPDDAAIDLHVKRLVGSGEEPRVAFWMVDGGPGQAGTTDFPPLMQLVQAFAPTWDVYTLDHRGTGLSARLGCPTAEAADSPGAEDITWDEWPACLRSLAERGVALEHYSAQAAALDLGFLLERLAEPGVPRFVWGFSYGTYLTHRYTQLFPDQPDGVILDSLNSPVDTCLDRYDVWGDHTIRKYYALCAADDACTAMLGDAPHETHLDALARFRAGTHCAALATRGVDARQLQETAFFFGMRWETRAVIPALFHRLTRCAPEDVDALAHAVDAVLGDDGTPPDAAALRTSLVLGFHISVSELLSETPLTPAEAEAAEEGLLVSKGVGLGMVRLFDLWPRYRPSAPWARRWTETDRPLLVLNGTLDLQTPNELAREMEAALEGAHQNYVEVPYANHGVMVQSPVAGDGPPCGLQLILSFVADPKVPPDTACLADLLPPDFAGNAALAEDVFRLPHLYDLP